MNSWRKIRFLKIYEMGSTQGQVDFLDIAHVKVDNFAVLEMYIKARLEKFVWSTLFVPTMCNCILGKNISVNYVPKLPSGKKIKSVEVLVKIEKIN